MSKLPTQLKWAQFVAALKNLECDELPSKGGSARHFERRSDKEIFTFHQPHGGDTIRQGTLSEYLRKLDITREAFENALFGETLASAAAAAEDRFRRSLETDGTIISNCNECYSVVSMSKIEDDVIAAKTAHLCPSIS